MNKKLNTNTGKSQGFFGKKLPLKNSNNKMKDPGNSILHKVIEEATGKSYKTGMEISKVKKSSFKQKINFTYNRMVDTFKKIFTKGPE